MLKELQTPPSFSTYLVINKCIQAPVL